MRHVRSGAIGSFFLNGVNQILLLLSTMLLTRLLGPSAFGTYAVLLSILMIASIPFRGGLPVFILRHIAAYRAAGDTGRINGLLQASCLAIGLSALLTALLVGLGRFFIPAPDYQNGLLIIAAIIPLMALMFFFSAIQRGLKHVIRGRLAEFLVQPGLFCLALAALYFSGRAETTAEQAMLYLAGSFALALIFSMTACLTRLPQDIRQARPLYDSRAWIKSALPLVFALGLMALSTNIDILMVGILAGEEEAGLYRVASRLAGLIPFFLVAANNAAGPTISSLYQQNKTGALQNLLVLTSRLTLLLTLPVAAVFFLFPDILLSLAFGQDFGTAATVLVILTASYLFSVSMGQVGQVLALTGHEKYAALSVGISVAVNVTLNFILIPHYGIEGAAVATGTGIVLWNILQAYWAARLTGLHCTAFGRILNRS